MAELKCGNYALTNIERGCRDAVGGIKRVWLFPFAYNMATLDASTNMIKTIDVTKANVCEFEFRNNTATLTSAEGGSNENGTFYLTYTLSLKFARANNAKRTAIMAAILGNFACVVEDMNGEYQFLGYNTPLSNGGGEDKGTGRADFSGYNLTITADENELAHFVDKAAWDAIIATA